MKLSRILLYGLPPILLLGLPGCGPGSDRKPTVYQPVPYTLTIDDKCNVTPEWRPVHLTDQVTWHPLDATHTYSIHFHRFIPFGSTTMPGPTIVSPDQAQTVTGGTQCHDPGHTSAATDCYFPYDISRDGNKCGDPGVHVTQTGGGSVSF